MAPQRGFGALDRRTSLLLWANERATHQGGRLDLVDIRFAVWACKLRDSAGEPAQRHKCLLEKASRNRSRLFGLSLWILCVHGCSKEAQLQA